MGEQLGRKFAEEKLGLKGASWVNPFDLDNGAFPPGFDDVLQDAAGNYWIVEYKGGFGDLDDGQMSPRWVTDNIRKLIRSESPWGEMLQKAKASGKLYGVALSTPWEDGIRAGATKVLLPPRRY